MCCSGVREQARRVVHTAAEAQGGSRCWAWRAAAIGVHMRAGGKSHSDVAGLWAATSLPLCVTQFMSHWDGLKTRQKDRVIVLAATNRCAR
jgi:hypothetical protein